MVLSSAKIHFGDQKGEHKVTPLHDTDDASQAVTKGDMLIMPANISHALHAKTRFKMLLVMIRGDKCPEIFEISWFNGRWI